MDIIPKKIGECSLVAANRETCFGEDLEKKILAITGTSTVQEAREKTNCGTNSCVVSKLRKHLGDKEKREVDASFKVPGPNSVKLLNNVNIDGILYQWSLRYPDFFAYNFNMRDYKLHSFHNGQVVNRPDSLETVCWYALYKDGYRTGACVVNTDHYHGRGIHWEALFVDCRKPPFSILFFNSSGNPPPAEFMEWMVKTQGELQRVCWEIPSAPPPQVIRVTKMRHQKTKTECGPYSLFFIWALLNGTPWEWFRDNRVPDEWVIEFRFHLYRDPEFADWSEFDWHRYNQKVKVEWEEE